MTDKELRVVMDILNDILQHHEKDAWAKLEYLQKNYKETDKFKSPYAGK